MTITTDIGKNHRLQPLLLLAACVLLSLLYCPPVDLFYDDKEIFRYAGFLISRGGIPYRDLFDHKPPLIYFLNYFGAITGPWGFWIIDTLLASLATMLFFRTCRQYRLSLPWLLPLLFNLLLRNYQVCRGVGMTREYTAIFQLIFFTLMMGANRFRYYWMGILTALIFFMQQDQILPLLPLLIYAVLTRSEISPKKRLLHILAGGTVITIPLLLYFGINHSLPAFWKEAFVFNFSWYTEKRSFAEHFHAIKEGLEFTNCEMPLLIALSLGAAVLLMKNAPNKPLVFAALLSAAFCPEFLSSRSGPAFNYYFLPLSATLTILVFSVFAFQKNNFLADKKCQTLFGFLLGCLPLYNAVQHGTHLTSHNKDIVEAYPVYDYLRRQPVATNHEDYQLYIFGDNNWVYTYNKFHILAPSHWIYQHFWEWFSGWDAGHQELEGIIGDLRSHRTKYILDYTGFNWRDQSAKSIWKDFLHNQYEEVNIPGATTHRLWQLKTTPKLPQ